MKNNQNPLLKHEILNQLTLIHFLIDTEEDFDVSKKEEINHLIHLTSLLVAHQDFIIEGKPDFFTEIFDLKEVIEIVVDIHEEKIGRSKVQIQPLGEKAMVQADRMMTKEVLDVIIHHLIKTSSSIGFKFNGSTHELSIAYEGPTMDIKNISVIDCLKQKKMSLREKILLITIRLAEGTDIKVEALPGEVRVKFLGFLYNVK